MKGVRQFGNQWHYYVVDIDGNHHKGYVPTREAAEHIVKTIKASFVGNEQAKKRKDAKTPDLPVGLCQSIKTKHTADGGKHFSDVIVATVVINGKTKTRQRTFGTIRTREQAIKECVEWRKKELKKCSKN